MKIFDIDFRKGSLIEKYSNSAGVNVGNKITKQEKGLAYAARQSNSGQITYPLQIWQPLTLAQVLLQ